MAIRNMQDWDIVLHERITENLSLNFTYTAFMWLCDYDPLIPNIENALEVMMMAFTQFVATTIQDLTFADNDFPQKLTDKLTVLFGLTLLTLSSKHHVGMRVSDDLRERRNNFGYYVRHVIYRYSNKLGVDEPPLYTPV